MRKRNQALSNLLGYRLIHMDEYEEEMKVLAGILEEKGQHPDGVILPILTNYGSDFICYYKSAEGVEQVCDLLHDFGDLIVMYDSPDKLWRPYASSTSRRFIYG